ncbi:MAG TPA: hypothetical protein VK588_16430 [Chitinophagaceae bacterium]|nr:hypothetical protein [Chitinophagaceae bacterium]
MKKTFIVLMLFIGILPELCAQSKSKEDKTFEIPENIIMHSRFYVDLQKGNKLTLELSDISDLDRIMNIDSLLTVFLNDLKPMKDSLSDPLASKRIDYVTDAQGRKKIRIQQEHPKGNNYLLNNGQLSSLKINQDTINIIGIIVNPPKSKQLKVSTTLPRYYHLLFYLNNIEELAGYMKGPLTEKFSTIQNNVHTSWGLILGGSSHYLKKDKTISADRPRGETQVVGDFLELKFAVNVQNYKSYFVPSFSVGCDFGFSNPSRTFKWQPGIYWEPHFLFGKDAQGKLKTYRNDFLTLTYGQGGTTDHDPQKDFTFSAVFSLGYLIHRSGDFIEKNTFRFGAGKLKLLKTTIEPSLYFNKFFKGVTPGIRITQRF